MAEITPYYASIITTAKDAPPRPPVQAGGSQTTQTTQTQQVAQPQPKTVALPPNDTGKTWGGPTSKRDLNFGHHMGVDAQGQPALMTMHPSGVPVWADTQTAITPDQYVNMPPFQQQELLTMVPAAWRDAFQAKMEKGVATNAQTQPQGVDNSQVSPVSTQMAQINQQSQTPASVADRARAQMILANQSTVAQNLALRTADLVAAKTDLIKDLSDPSKQAEAMARLQLLDQQIGQIQDVAKHVQDYTVPNGLSAKDAQTVADSFSQINDQIAALSDPKQMATAQANLSVLYNHLANPQLADQKDPVVINQAVTVLNITQRVQDLVDQENGLIGDLGDPKKAPEAQARIDLLNQQISQVVDVLNHVKTYQRPANLTSDQSTAVADTLSKLNDAVTDLSDPKRTAATQALLPGYYWQLQNPLPVATTAK